MIERTIVGMPFKTATPDEMREAIMFGRFLSRAEGTAFYQYRGNVYVVSDKPLPAPPEEGCNDV